MGKSRLKHRGNFKMAKKNTMKPARLAAWLVLLAKLLDVGFSLRQSVQFCRRVMPRDEPWLCQVERHLADGQSFATAIKTLVDADIYVQLVLAEQHGQLSATLAEIGAFLQAQQKQRRKLIVLLQYPFLLLILLVIMGVALEIFVYPELRTWQDKLLQHWWQSQFWQCSVGFGLAFFGIYSWSSLRRWRKMTTEQRVRARCRWLLLGKMYRQYYAYYLISTMAMLLSHGLSLKECCRVASAFDNSSLLAWWGQQIALANERNGNYIRLIEECPYLPLELSIFLKQGLSKAHLARELTVFSQLIFKQLLATIERLLIYVQPIMFLVVAIAIVGMYLSLLLPIYHSIQGVY